MVTLPKEFVATRLPGYFWNTKDQRLYSVKVTGALRPLKKQAANRWNHGKVGYQISHMGHKRFMSDDYLKKLKPKTQVFPLFKEQLKLL
jgi:hypothetical protein